MMAIINQKQQLCVLSKPYISPDGLHEAFPKHHDFKWVNGNSYGPLKHPSNQSEEKAV
jgi:hypothetical protein